MVELGQSRTYANHNLQRIKQIFRWAASEQLVSVLVPQALQTVSGLTKGRTTARETDPVLPSRTRLSMQHCRTCRQRLPIWCVCKGLLECGRARSASCGPAISTAVAKSGATHRSNTKPSITGDSESSVLAQKVRPFCYRTCSVILNRSALVQGIRNGSGSQISMPDGLLP